MYPIEHMKPKKKKVIKKKVNIQKINYGRPRRYYRRRPLYYRPPPVITRPVYTYVERSNNNVSYDNSILRNILGFFLVVVMICLIIFSVKR